MAFVSKMDIVQHNDHIANGIFGNFVFFFMLFGYDNIVTICLFMLSVIAKGSLAVAYSRCCKDDLPRTRMCLIVSTGSLFLMWVVSIFGQLEDVAYAMVDFLGMGYCVEKAWYRYNDGRSSEEGR